MSINYAFSGQALKIDFQSDFFARSQIMWYLVFVIVRSFRSIKPDEVYAKKLFSQILARRPAALKMRHLLFDCFTVLARHFLFFCVPSFTWNFMKLAFCFLLFWLKNETGCGFIIFKGLKLWNRPKSVGKKKKLTARSFATAFIIF